MASAFDTIEKSFKDVPVTDDQIDLIAFLLATESLVKILGIPSLIEI